MSGNGDFPGLPKLGENAKACVELLKDALEFANEGKITSIAIIACTDGAVATVMAGMQAGDLYLGAGYLQDDIKEATRAGNVAKRKSGIIRVGR